MYQAAWQQVSYRFSDLKELMAKATPPRSGDILAGLAATNAEENVAAKMALADVPLKQFLTEAVIPYEEDDVTRLILDSHDAAAFAPISHMTVGAFRDWLLSEAATTDVLSALAPGITPEMAAATSKIMRNQDLILARAQGGGRHTLSRHHRPQGAHGGTAAAQSSDRRQARDRSLHRRRAHARVRRCRDRRQSGQRQRGDDPRSPRHARRHHRPLRHPDAGVRADPRDNHHRGHRPRRARRPRVPVGRRHAKR